jgi:hypothetical protein
MLQSVDGQSIVAMLLTANSREQHWNSLLISPRLHVGAVVVGQQ